MDSHGSGKGPVKPLVNIVISLQVLAPWSQLVSHNYVGSSKHKNMRILQED